MIEQDFDNCKNEYFMTERPIIYMTEQDLNNFNNEAERNCAKKHSHLN